MARSELFYTPAIGAPAGVVHPTPEGSGGALYLCERRHDCVQLAGFGQGPELADWLQRACGAVPPPGMSCAALDGDCRMLATGPGVWLLLAEPGALGEMVEDAEDTAREFAVVNDYSDGRSVVFELQGPAAVEVLRMHLGIDLDDAAFPLGKCAATGIDGVSVVVLREAPEVFQVLVQRSFAMSLWEILLDSATAYGAVIGELS